MSGLLARVLEGGHLNLQTQTPVSSITVSADGISVIHTSRGSIKAQKVIFATNGYTAGVLPLYTEKIIPVKGTCSHISVSKHLEFPPPHLSYTYGITYEPPRLRDYLVPRPDGGVICGGANHTFVANRKLWFNNFDDSTLFPVPATQQHFQTVMQDNFRGWENSGARVDMIWTGSMTFNLSLAMATISPCCFEPSY